MPVELLMWVAAFAGTLFLLVKCADFFIDFSEKIGLVFGIPQLVIGVTVVALGTSLPELASSIAAIYKGSSEIVLSNVMGSNITNVLLVMGAVCIVGRGKILETNPPIIDTLFLLGATLFLSYAVYDSVFTFNEAIICIGGLVMYLGHCVRASMKHVSEDEKPDHKWYFIPIILLSGFGIYLSAEYNILSIIKISELINVGTEVISSTAVALGTSLPELLVSMAAAKKGKISLAVGNLIGSNIFNALGVSGVSRFFGEIIVPELTLTLLMPLMIIAALGLIFVYSRKKIPLIPGIIFLSAYVLFLVRVVMLSL